MSNLKIASVPATSEYSIQQFNRAWMILADQSKVDDFGGSEYHSTRNDWLAGKGTQEPIKFIEAWQENMKLEAYQRSIEYKQERRSFFDTASFLLRQI